MSDRRRQRPRYAVAALIAAGHAGVIAMAMLAHGPKPIVAQPEPIMAALLLPEEVESPPAALPVPTAAVALPDVVVPIVHLDIQQEAPPQIAVTPGPAPQVVEPPPVAMAAPAAPLAATAESASNEPVSVTAVEYLRAPVVAYPPAAKQARAEGTVHVRAVVEKDGRVREVRVNRSSGFTSLDKAACDAVSGALFRPYLHNGAARAAVVVVPVDFALKTRSAGRGKPRSEKHCDRPQEGRDAPRCHPERDDRLPENVSLTLAD